MPAEKLICDLRRLERRIGRWVFIRYCRNRGYSIHFVLHVLGIKASRIYY